MYDDIKNNKLVVYFQYNNEGVARQSTSIYSNTIVIQGIAFFLRYRFATFLLFGD